MKLHFRALVLDMDGLMFDTESLAKRAWQKAFRDHGIDLSGEVYNKFLGLGSRESSDLILQLFGDKFPIVRFNDDAERHYAELLKLNGVPVKEGLFHLLDVVDELGFPVAVATSSRCQIAMDLLRRSGLESRVSVLVAGDQVVKSKPAPDIFLEAARRLNMSPKECLVLEDSDAGANAAFAAGMPVIIVPDLSCPAEETIRRAICVVKSLDDVVTLMR